MKGKPSLSLSEWPDHTSLAPVTCSHHSSRLIRHIPNTNFCHRVSILYQEETMITMTSSRCDGEGLVVIPLSHWRCFQCDLCGETFEPEDDLKNQRRAQHQNQCLVVIELSHQPLQCYFTLSSIHCGFSSSMYESITSHREIEIATPVIP